MDEIRDLLQLNLQIICNFLQASCKKNTRFIVIKLLLLAYFEA
jgi:hypothetical protein